MTDNDDPGFKAAVEAGYSPQEVRDVSMLVELVARVGLKVTLAMLFGAASEVGTDEEKRRIAQLEERLIQRETRDPWTH